MLTDTPRTAGARMDDAGGYRFARWLSTIVILMAACSLALGVLIGLHPAPTYHLDEWTWFYNVLQQGWIRGSVCNQSGHPIALPDLHLVANYHLFDGSPTARAVVVMAVAVCATVLAGALTIRNLGLPLHRRIAILLVFACFGAWGGLYHKLWWGFGLTDSLVLLGAAVTAWGSAHLLEAHSGKASGAVVTMIAGGAIGTFSFASGFVIWPAFGAILPAARVGWRPTLLFIAVGAVLVMTAIWLPSCARSDLFTYEPVGFHFDPISTLTTAAAILGILPAHTFVLAQSPIAQTLYPLWVAIGLLIMAAVCALGLRIFLRRERDPAMIALTGIAAVPIGAALLVALSRSQEFGTLTAYFPRYAALAMPVWLALLAIALRFSLRDGTRLRRAGAIALPIIAAVFLVSNILWTQQSVHRIRYVTLSALSFVVDPSVDNRAFKAAFVPGLMVTVVPAAVTLEKGFFGSPMALAAKRIGQSMPAVNAQRHCEGVMTEIESYRAPASRAFDGWAVPPDGDIAYLEVYADGVLKGVGMKTGTARPLNASEINRRPLVAKLIGKVPLFAPAFGVGPAFLAMAKSPPGAAPAEPVFVCVLANGDRLLLQRPPAP